jgi:hypothetical protein
MLFSMMATEPQKVSRERKLLLVDVRRASFNAVATRDTIVHLPPEMAEEGMCAKLKKCMYGTRDAATRWEVTYVQALVRNGFEQGKASPCCFRSTERNLQVVVHGDDFTALGCDTDLDWFEGMIQSEFERKVRGRLGSSSRNDKEMRISNRIVRWTPEGITYEADQRHAEILMKEMGLQDNPVATPGVKEKACERNRGTARELDRSEARMFRSYAARANYLAQDRVDVAYACKEICREMAKPSEAGWDKLKRVVRYLLRQPRVLYMYRWQLKGELTVYVDTDWAGCATTRRSTSGGAAVLGIHFAQHWSTTQSTIALSSGEAELGGIVKGPKQGLEIQSVARDLGLEVELKILTDSTAARAMVNRKGIGRVRHLEVSDLWVQDAVKIGKFLVEKVEGEHNPAKILTKHVEA